MFIKSKKFISASALIFISVLFLWSQPDEENKVDIFFTSSINGNLDGCECVAVPRAGLVSTGVYLRQRDLSDSILVDLGDFMDVYPDDLLADNIFHVFSELNYDLLSLGDQEFTEGLDYLLEKAELYPFINNSLRINGSLISDSPVIIEREGRRIGFASIIDPQVFYFHPANIKEALVVEDINEASDRLLSELDNMDTQARVLLFHGPSNKAEALFQDDEAWDFVLFAHDQKLHQENDGGNRYIASPGDNGNRVGRATIYFDGDNVERIDGDFIYFDYMEDPRDPVIKKRLDLYKKEMIARLQGD
ncbi:MAG: hypothetical protein JEY99_13540 [Spirochaetales bacterium]|nr:hypothetical protein [Spirochaetales bacterium]